jgi:hypothetical protein
MERGGVKLQATSAGRATPQPQPQQHASGRAAPGPSAAGLLPRQRALTSPAPCASSISLAYAPTWGEMVSRRTSPARSRSTTPVELRYSGLCTSAR